MSDVEITYSGPNLFVRAAVLMGEAIIREIADGSPENVATMMFTFRGFVQRAQAAKANGLLTGTDINLLADLEDAWRSHLTTDQS